MSHVRVIDMGRVDPHVVPTEALRFNSDKPEVHYILFYPKFLEALAQVQTMGGHKYGYANWTAGGKPDQEYWDSGLRHLIAAFNGEVYDDDTGCQHLAHAIWNLMQLIEQNHPDEPALKPGFDVDAFIEKWADTPKNEMRSR